LEKNVLACTKVGAYFQSPEGQKGNSDLKFIPQPVTRGWQLPGLACIIAAQNPSIAPKDEELPHVPGHLPE
jgi:hypothetical protein